MDPVLLAAIAGVLVALATLVYARRTYRRQYPKRRLLLTVSTTRLVQQRVPDLEIRHQGRPLTDPRFVRIRIESVSRADIPSTTFDGGKPIELTFDREVLVTDISQSGIDLEVDGGKVTLDPQLIKSGARATIGAITEGKAKFDFRNSLVDVDVLMSDGVPSPSVLPTALAIVAGSMAVGVVTLLVGSLVFRLF